ncbi:glycosyltransferase [Chromohalobacter israelensis]|uniref:glycosyltransferase n=1 Tax=Chromohalobacter israelensis TaxID=141390 RepID=UPI000AF99720|nr:MULTISPECIES: glycosyltransferase [Chromohalobacter]MBZ5875942.1 glycosyltransferase [Chromohalobacter salexigens]MDF9435869.1 glycosyltransferase [Chromohalobacter israelensis]
MNILMFTNTYCPIVGGVSESVQRLKRCLQRQGHSVLIVAPKLDGQPRFERDVVRVVAMQRFNGSDFSLPVPVPGQLYEAIEAFQPDLVHAHHPFLLGDTAARVAQTYGLPLIFTHHTLYEHYTHYVPGDSPRMQRFAIALASEYTRLCDAVIAPSESIAELLAQRGVRAEKVRVIPSGVDTRTFAQGDGGRWRQRFGIPDDAMVVGHVGRLAMEKNLDFLAAALARFLARHPKARALIVGEGEARMAMHEHAAREGVADRFHYTGKLHDQALIDAYHAMDAFAFASHSETQGMVIAEAMAAGLPVVAINASGVREVLRDGVNGIMLPRDDIDAFANALETLQSSPRREALRQGALESAHAFDERRCAERCLTVYRQVLEAETSAAERDDGAWEKVRGRLEAEWRLLRHRGRVLRSVFQTLPVSETPPVEEVPSK